jgi:hypothetical protein
VIARHVESIVKAPEDARIPSPVSETQLSPTDRTMASPLQALAEQGALTQVQLAPFELRRLVDRAAGLLADARRTSLCADARVCLVHAAAAAMAGAALAAKGFRARDRAVAFGCLEQAASLAPVDAQQLAALHGAMEQAQFQNVADIDEATLARATALVDLLIERVSAFRPPRR